jgi:hypothetical protein
VHRALRPTAGAPVQWKQVDEQSVNVCQDHTAAPSLERVQDATVYGRLKWPTIAGNAAGLGGSSFAGSVIGGNQAFAYTRPTPPITPTPGDSFSILCPAKGAISKEVGAFVAQHLNAVAGKHFSSVQVSLDVFCAATLC